MFACLLLLQLKAARIVEEARMEQKALENLRVAVEEMRKFKENLENTVRKDEGHSKEAACAVCTLPDSSLASDPLLKLLTF